MFGEEPICRPLKTEQSKTNQMCNSSSLVEEHTKDFTIFYEKLI